MKPHKNRICLFTRLRHASLSNLPKWHYFDTQVTVTNTSKTSRSINEMTKMEILFRWHFSAYHFAGCHHFVVKVCDVHIVDDKQKFFTPKNWKCSTASMMERRHSLKHLLVCLLLFMTFYSWQTNFCLIFCRANGNISHVRRISTKKCKFFTLKLNFVSENFVFIELFASIP